MSCMTLQRATFTKNIRILKKGTSKRIKWETILVPNNYFEQDELVIFMRVSAGLARSALPSGWRGVCAPCRRVPQITGTSCIYQNDSRVAHTATRTVQSLWRGPVPQRHLKGSPCVFRGETAAQLSGVRSHHRSDPDPPDATRHC